MATVRSVDFLPEIFQTDTNRQFLAATLDQLIQEPRFKKTQGFIGRKIGPGVNPEEKYVIEPDQTRANYQLEPGVINLEADTNRIKDAITYPGILDSISYQGGDAARPDRLFESDFYTWDPFVNWDTFINFSQYFWLPSGPDAVDVAATGVPATDNFVVTRSNAYTFSGLPGENPTIDLIRGGSYTFQVAQNQTETVNFRVTNFGTSSWVINGSNNPTLTLVRGNTYVFTLNLDGVYPFLIKSQPTTGVNNVYNQGVTNNGAVEGRVTFTVPQTAPDTLYYSTTEQSNLKGTFEIIDGTPGTGAKFWIQTDPGINGRIPTTPNLSSRQVYGVENNGEDLGTITFNVPTKTAQSFYYGLNSIGTVDLVTTLRFNQINGVPLETFLNTFGGIDGIRELDGRTLIFDTTELDTVSGGWYKQTLFDPLAQDSVLNGEPGSYDVLLYDQEDEVPLSDRLSIWRINLIDNDGYVYIDLTLASSVAELDKFSISYGETYASTQWYKNDAGFFREIPALTAVKDELYYQDGTDPLLVGRIRLLEPGESSTLFVSEILGKTTYTSPNGVSFSNGLKVVLRGDVVPASYINQEYYVSGVGTAIQLLPVVNFITPETYVVDGDDSTLGNQPGELDYLTIDRASQDLNAWTRSNRWFHIDVINATAEYNNTVALIDNAYRAKRPIIEFRPGVRLFNMGTQGKEPVDIIDFSETDAFSNIEGSTSYSVDGYEFTQGSRVIFAADLDPNVRNKIYEVQFVVPDSIEPYIPQPIITLVPTSDSDVLLDQCTVCLDGDTLTGKTFWYNGVSWQEAQQKTGIQQAPLFNIYDSNGVSFSDLTVYPSSTFEGSKLFSYAVSDTSAIDPILNFPLQYLNLNNVGDIVFENNFYKDSFLYVRDNVSVTRQISSGFVREYTDRTVFTRQIGWNSAATPTQIRQQFSFEYNGQPLQLDIQAQSDGSVPAIKLYVSSKFRDPGTYSVTVSDTGTLIVLDDSFYAIGDLIEVLALSSQTSRVGFYQVPINLQNNPLNGNAESFTLGTIRTHYESICENLTTLSGPVNGANNTRDLGNIGPYGLIILQQSAPLTLTGYFNRSKDFNIFASLQYNSREYQKYKNLMLEEVTRLAITFETPGEILTEAIANITAGRTEINPFYWSDMLPVGSVFLQTQYPITLITTNVFDTRQVYNYTSANYLGMNVYKNNTLLTRGVDYTVAVDAPTITVLTSLEVGDTVTLEEFTTTAGTFVPNTPSKMGLYPVYRPEIITVKTTSGTAQVIQGHDGSQTPVFGDIRDDVLLEFETRIYNNIKLDGNEVPLTIDEILPGQFRQTGYTYAELNNVLSQDFLSYVGWNKLNYNTQDFFANNEFSYNYSKSQSRIDNPDVASDTNLLGAWRGIYRWFYDTEDPSSTPWQMLGFSIKPDWWNSVYGPGPYTSDNLVLWDDLEAGLVADPMGSYELAEYARPGLSLVIPVDSEGNLLSPLQAVVGSYNFTTFRRSWAAGDGGPVEASWWNSSAYPFAVMHLLALNKPAKFYSLFADRDLYRYNEEFAQYLYNDRYRLDSNGIEVYGNGVSKASFINWIVDYNRQSGLDSTTLLTQDLANLDVRLCYRMASFSDKQYIKVFTEKSSPNSLNTTLQIPDESYNLLLYKNQVFDQTVFSSVVVQIVSGGYAIFGYSTTNPYFEILVSQSVGRLETYSAGGITVKVPTQYTNTVARVPYGYVFSNPTSVADFLLSYGKFLETQGFTFTASGNGIILNWSQMVNEFLYWSQQGWSENALINLNPLADKLELTKPGAVLDSIVTQTIENSLLDQNRKPLPTRDFNIVRLNNKVTLQPLNDQTISYANLRFTNFENMMVFDNQSVFGDLIYEPITGARQSRLNLVAQTSTDWDGTVNARGFILNQDNITEWEPLKKYTKGSVVKYKNEYWSAARIVDPSLTFDFNNWIKSDYTQIEKGLLPNLANKANQLQTAYSVYSANLETDTDLVSYGLIGFRPRQYMAALNLDDTSQVNVYSQFLKSKGTIASAELLSRANLGKEAADYDIFENWAVQRAVYGANANRSFIELRLDRSLLSSNPSLVQVIDPQQSSQADQTIDLSAVWRQSYKLTSPDFLPTTEVSILDTGLPSAGYVNLEDVDITTFDINNTASILANLELVSNGSTIWAAKINNYDWSVYRTSSISGSITHVCDNLDGTSLVKFDQPHGLSANDKLIIKQFDANVDGMWTVLSVPTISSVTIAYSFVGTQKIINGQGLGFTLQTQRVSQASDILNLPFANELQTGIKIWVDNDGSGHWQVLEKQSQFTQSQELAPVLLGTQERFGSSVAQSSNRLATLVGSPDFGEYDTGVNQGAVYVYVKQATNEYQPVSPTGSTDAVLTLDIDGVRAFGNSLDFGGSDWAAAGASQSLGIAEAAGTFVPGRTYEIVSVGSTNFIAIGAASNTIGVQFTATGAGSGTGTAALINIGYVSTIYRDPVLGIPGSVPLTPWQLITPPDLASIVEAEFGYSVAVSADERWMYVGAPGINQVYAYGKVDWQNQFLRVRTPDPTSEFDISATIQINAATQVTVVLNNTLLALGTDYTVSGDFGTVTLTTPTAANDLVDIRRISSKDVDQGTYTGITGTSGSGSGATFSIVRQRNTLSSVTLTGPGSSYTPSSTVAITINQADFGGSGAGSSALVVNVTTNADGEAIGIDSYTWTPPSSLATVFSLNEYFFNVPTINSFSVLVDNVLYRPDIDYTYNSGTSDLTFITVPVAGTSIIVRSQEYYQYVDTIDSSLVPGGLSAGDRFGHSISTTTDGRQVLVGCPNQTIDSTTQAGAVYIFDRNVQRFIYGTDASSESFTVDGTVTEPVSVIVNNQFLINEQNSIVGADGTFSVSGTTITIEDPLQVGDVVEIETNQFAFMQQVVQGNASTGVDAPVLFANFGQALDLCGYNCSLYIGAPEDSTQQYKAGSVQRSVNQTRLYGSITSIASPSLTPGDTLRVNNMEVAIPVGSLQDFADAITATVPNVSASVADNQLTISVLNLAAATPGNLLTVLPGSTGTAWDDLGFTPYVWTQTIYSPYPVDFAKFGYSVNIDSSNVNLVVGAPNGTLYLFTIFDDGDTEFDYNTTIFFSTIVNSGAVYTYDYLPSATDSLDQPGNFVFGLQISNVDLETLDGFGTALDYRDGVLLAGSPGDDTDTAADKGKVLIFDNPTRAPAWMPIREQQPVVDVSLLNGVFTYDRITSARTQQFDFFDPLQGKVLGIAQQNIDFIGALDPGNYNVGPINNRGMSWSGEHVGKIWWDTSNVRFIDPNQDDIVYASRRWGQVFPGSQVDIYQWIQSDVPPASYTGPGVPLNSFSYSISTRLGTDGVFITSYYFWVRGITTVSNQQGKTLSIATIANYIENPRGSGIPYIAALNASTVALYNAADIIEAQDTIINIEYDRERNDSNVHVEYELIAQDKADAFISSNLYRKLQDSFCGVDTAGNLVPDYNLSPAEKYGVQFRPRQSMFVDRFAALKNYFTRTNNILALYPITENRTFTLLNSQDPEPPSIDPVTSEVYWNLTVANLEILSYQNIDAVPLGYLYLVQSDSSQNGLWTIYEVQASETLLGERVLGLVKVQNYDTTRYWSYIDWYLPGYNSSTKVIAEVPNYSALETISVPIGSSVRVVANAQGKFEIYVFEGLNNWTRVALEDGTIEISAELWDYALGRFGFDVEVFDAQYFDQEPVIETRKIIQAINQELLIDDLAIERNRLLTLMFNFILSEFSAPEWLVKTSLIDVDHRIRSLEPFQNFRQDNQEFVLDYINEVKPYHVQIREFNLKYNGFDEYQGDTTDFDVPAYYDTSLTIPQYVSPILLPYEHGTAQISNTLSDTDANALLWQRWPYNQWFTNHLLVIDSIIKTSGGSGYSSIPTIVIGEEWQANTSYTAGYQFFYNSNLYTVIESGISGTIAPTFTSGIETDGTASIMWVGVPAEAFATINYATGQVSTIVVTENGSGYRYRPSITFIGGGNTSLIPARAYAVLEGVGFGTNLNQPGAVPEYYTLSRSFRTTIKFDRFQYLSQVQEWTANVSYIDGSLVRYQDQIYRALSSDGSSAVQTDIFDLADWEPVSPSVLDLIYNEEQGYYQVAANTSYITGADRTKGLYVPGVNSPGLDLPLLIDGIDYPGVQVFGKDFDSQQQLDATYAGSFADIYLGTRPTDINIDGGQFIGPYEGHAPEELVSGAEYDTVDIRVYTRPGSDWSFNGHGFQIGNRRFEADTALPEFDWSGLVENPATLIVSNVGSGVTLRLNQDYEVNWDDQTITMLSALSIGTIINISVYELGGGSQLYRDRFVGTGADYTIVPVAYSEIDSVILFVNGQLDVPYDWEPYAEGVEWNELDAYTRLDVVYTTGPTTYYRALSDVPAGIDISNTDFWLEFVPSSQSKVNFTTSYGSNDAVTITVFGVDTVGAGHFIEGREYTVATIGTTDFTLVGAASNTVGTVFTATGSGSGTGTATTDYNWSTPVTQTWTVTPAINASRQVTLTNNIGGTNIANMIVEVGGLRLKPYDCVEYTGDDVTSGFILPTRGGYSQVIVNAGTDVTVWVDDILQTQIIGSDPGSYTVSNWTGTETREVQFVDPPPTGSRILIAVSTVSGYLVSGSLLQLTAAPPVGSYLSVTTFNDTSQQDITTLTWVGPVESGAFIRESFDDGPYDPLFIDDGSGGRDPSTNLLNGDPGSFDFETGVVTYNNNFNMGRSDLTGGRLWVTLNGARLFDGTDYSIDGTYLILAAGTVSTTDIVAVTMMTESIVPEAMAFRVFQDMRGVQATYRITEATSTQLSQALGSLDTVAYLVDASRLTQPNLENGVFGVCTIDGERIMYRTRDLATNSISGLMRGTAGTAASSHEAEAAVYDLSRGNLLDSEYQDTFDSVFFAAYNPEDPAADRPSSNQTVFVATGIGPVDAGDSSGIDTRAISVFVGGIQQDPYVVLSATELELGLSYIIQSLGDTDWNAVAGTTGISYAVNDRITVNNAAEGTGQAYARNTEYLWTCTDFGGSDVTIEFTTNASVNPPLTAPADSKGITIGVRRGLGWYGIGYSVDNGQPMQEVDTKAARFLRGE